MQGGREFRGWGVDRHMAADRWDMHVAEVVGKKKKPEYPRPKSKSKTSKGGRSLRSLFPGR